MCISISVFCVNSNLRSDVTVRVLAGVLSILSPLYAEFVKSPSLEGVGVFHLKHSYVGTAL